LLFFLLIGVMWVLSGCALQGLRSPMPSDVTLPQQVLLSEVPFFAQKAYQCGPAALAMALQASGVTVTPDELTTMVYMPGRKGSLQIDLIGGTRRHGRLAYPINGFGCLVEELAAGHPVIVFQNLGLSWLPRWHYAVAVGYDASLEQIILHTGTVAMHRVGWSTFQRTWKRGGDWGLLVLAPDEMPVCAQEQTYLKAALGLQQAGQLRQAQEAFQTAVGKWPLSFNAFMGLGNAQFANGDYVGAVRSFRTAAALDSRSGDALNNLAHVLAELGWLDEALEVIQLALTKVGVNHEIYLETFHEIQKRMGRTAP
jgi:hypothetical protein